MHFDAEFTKIGEKLRKFMMFNNLNSVLKGAAFEYIKRDSKSFKILNKPFTSKLYTRIKR